MKTLHMLTDGTRLVLISREEWDGLATATEIAFEEEECVPEPLREVAASLWHTFHRAIATDVARPEKVDRYTGLRNAVRAVLDAAHDFRTNAVLSSVPTDAIRRLADALEAAPTYTEPLPPQRPNLTPAQQAIVDETNRAVETIERRPIVGAEHPGATLPSSFEADRYRRAAVASDALCYRLPTQIGAWTRDGDTMSGAIFWHRPDVRAVVYATPSWEGLPGTPVAVMVDDLTDQIDKPSLPVDALDYIGREEQGADAYVRALTPVLDAVFEEYATRKSGRPTFRITLDGDEVVPFYAFPEAGSFFGVWHDEEDTLYQVPMGVGGQPPEEPSESDVVEVSNMSEAGDRALLASINAFFGTTFTPEQFSGR